MRQPPSGWLQNAYELLRESSPPQEVYAPPRASGPRRWRLIKTGFAIEEPRDTIFPYLTSKG
jgi:hypothetical protein